MRVAVLLAVAGGVSVSAAAFELSPKVMVASTQWPYIDLGLVGDFNLSSDRIAYEGRAEYWLEDNSIDHISTRQTLLYRVASRRPVSLQVGGGFWLSTEETSWGYIGPGPWEEGPDWVTELRPFVEVRVPLSFDWCSIAPIFRYQVSAYRNYEEPGHKYHYVEPELIFDYVVTDRWAFEARARYWRGVGNDWADVGFVELGPRISW